MAATGYTPIYLYYSSTATNQPAAGNLGYGELAINITDKNLFFKDSTNTINAVPIRQSSASSNGWLSSTDWSTFNGKAPAFTYTTGYIPYGQGTTTPTQSANLQFDGSTLTIGGVSTDKVIGIPQAVNSGFKFLAVNTANNAYKPIALEGSSVEFYYAGVKGLELLSNGNVSVSTGNLVIGTSGKGIDFSATAGTGTSELLADYEEGTFTATLTGGTTAPSTPITRTGYYTKIGDMVSVYISFSNVNTTGASGQIQVTGLPYTSSSAITSSGTIWVNQSSTSGVIAIDTGVTSLGMLSFAGSAANWSAVGAGCYARMQITYKSA